MKQVLRFAAPFMFVASTIFCASAGTVSLNPPTVWTKTDVPPDPTITFGTLPNGMRYLIKKNDHPDHAVSVYLRIAAGSFDETPKEAGLAHFIEHMGFRGTAHIPDGELDKRLGKLGLSTGSDSNAHTNADATVYTFDFPQNDKDTLDTALTLTRDIASGMLFEPKAVETEKKVVLAEFRLRDTPALHAYKANQTALFGEALAQATMPIGLVPAIEAATPEDLRRYYQAHYRPERATLIVVGGVDVNAVETAIKTQFSDWKAAAPKRPDPSFPIPDPVKALTVKSFVEAGANSGVSLVWMKPFDPTPETKARDRRDTVRSIAFTILNQRLRALATSANPPFLAASGGAHNSYRLAFFASLGASVGSGDHAKAVKALAETLSAITTEGVSQAEVDRAIAQERTGVSTEVTAAPSRKNPQLAGNYTNQIGANDVIDGPENWQPTFEASVKGLTADQVTKVLQELYRGAPLVLVSSPTAIAGGDAALAAAYTEGLATPHTQLATSAPVVWPYTDFGPEGTIATKKTIDDLGVTFVTFANGVRVTLKPTKFLEGQIDMAVRIGHGRIGLDKSKALPRWAITGAWGTGGLGKISNADLPKALSGKQWGAAPEMGETAFGIVGHTRAADLATELQLVTALITDPAFRPEGLEQVKSGTATALAQATTTAPGVFGLNYWSFVHNGDKRWAPPSIDEVKATELPAVQALIAPTLKDGPIEILLVGDFAIDEALGALQKTFGALPKRQVDVKPLAGHEELPKPSHTPFVMRYKGPSQEATAFLGWQTTGLFPDTQNARTLAVLDAVMRQRLFEELRTKEGITYTPQTSNTNSWVTPSWGFLSVQATVPSPKLAEFYAAAQKVAADLATTEIPADELERARGPLINHAERNKKTNGYWMGLLAGAQIEPRALDLIRSQIPAYQAVTAKDVLAVAKKYLTANRSFRAIAAPEGFAIPADLP